jgi:hypothetical protein
MDPETQLNQISGDMVTHTKWQPVLRELFMSSPGQWCSIADLDPSSQVEAAYGEESRPLLRELRFAWLLDPYAGQDSTFAIVIFYLDGGDTWWKRIALFNRASL